MVYTETFVVITGESKIGNNAFLPVLFLYLLLYQKYKAWVKLGYKLRNKNENHLYGRIWSVEWCVVWNVITVALERKMYTLGGESKLMDGVLSKMDFDTCLSFDLK